MRKVDDGEEKKKKKEKIMTFIVASNVIASRPPERRPNGTPHTLVPIKYGIVQISLFFKSVLVWIC